MREISSRCCQPVMQHLVGYHRVHLQVKCKILPVLLEPQRLR